MADAQLVENTIAVTSAYMRKRRKQLALFFLAGAISMILLLSGVTGVLMNHINENSKYEMLISISSGTEPAQRIDAYKEAIEIHPENPKAYVLILEAYEENGKFGIEENAEFLSLYNAYSNNLPKNDKGTYELNYKIGRMYFCFYTENNERVSMSTKVQKAHGFFEKNQTDMEYPDKALNDCYFTLCDFYKTYILDSAYIKDLTIDSVDDLFARINQSYGQIENADSYDRLVLYTSVINLLYNQRKELAKINYAQETVIAMMQDTVNRAAELSVQKEATALLKQQIEDYSEEYMQAIQRAYTAKGGQP